jgi:hypothetical protein
MLTPPSRSSVSERENEKALAFFQYLCGGGGESVAGNWNSLQPDSFGVIGHTAASHSVIVWQRRGAGIAPVVRVPGLGLEREKHGGPAALSGIKEDQTTVGPRRIIVPVLVVVALIHVHIVNSVAGLKAKDMIWTPHFRTPSRAVRIETFGGVGNSALHPVVEHFD